VVSYWSPNVSSAWNAVSLERGDRSSTGAGEARNPSVLARPRRARSGLLLPHPLPRQGLRANTLLPRTTKDRHLQVFLRAPERIRTSDLRFRSRLELFGGVRRGPEKSCKTAIRACERPSIYVGTRGSRCPVVAPQAPARRNRSDRMRRGISRNLFHLPSMTGRPSMDGNAPRGPGWLPLPSEDEMPPAPKWWNGRSITAVWRDTLPFTLGGLIATGDEEYARMRLGARWNADVEAGSDEDVDQAIAAKLDIGFRTLPVLARAELVVIDPTFASAIPEWNEDELTEYASRAVLPFTPLYLDFESATGHATNWHEPSWPDPFQLRGSLLWRSDGILSVVPYGSCGGAHPWGGTDYQGWSRWLFLDDEAPEIPTPGRGDNIVRGETIASWVNLASGSICAHQARLGFNLVGRALRVLWALDTLEVDFAPEPLSRAERRRAARSDSRVGVVPVDLPPGRPTHVDTTSDVAEPIDGKETECPISTTHTRLNHAHVLWHEALEQYDDPDGFLVKVNALIEALRNVTFVLQKTDEKNLPVGWYAAWRERLKADTRLGWLVDARNTVVHRGDLETRSTVQAQIVGEDFESKPVMVELRPGESPQAAMRRIHLPPMNDRVRRHGVLVLERRWVIDEFPEEELLDLLAACYAVLDELVSDAHAQLDSDVDTCQKTRDIDCFAPSALARASGRLPCMHVGKAARTMRRNLESGAPMTVGTRTMQWDPADNEAIRRRYAETDIPAWPERADLFEHAERLHTIARQFLQKDGYHDTVLFLLRGGEPVYLRQLEFDNLRDIPVLMDAVAAEATRLAADGLILTTEVWEAPQVPESHSESGKRASERSDRSEALVTISVERSGRSRTWRTSVQHDGAEDQLSLGDPVATDEIPPVVIPVLRAWNAWPR
jgi:hypothetical protein